MSPANRKVTDSQLIEAYERFGGNISAMAREFGTKRPTLIERARKLGLNRPLVAGQVAATRVVLRPLPTKGVKRYILSSVQNNTHVHKPVLDNMLAMAKHYDAEILLASFSYNSNAYGKLSVKKGTKGTNDNELWYDPLVEPYLAEGDQNIQLAPGLIWCGRMNTIPTASNPLSGFETYTGRQSGILPHAKLAAESIVSGKFEPTKFTYTTGTVTKRNYIQKRQGLRAEEHHSYGGLLVEVDPDGRWFVRQLCADGHNKIYDWDVLADGGKVTTGHSVEAITWGDCHFYQVDPVVRQLAWGKGQMLDQLKPRHQFIHDMLVMAARGHHDINNPHRFFEHHVEGTETVEAEVKLCAEFLYEVQRDGCKTVVVDSNHDRMIERWLREADYRRDPPNAIYFLKAQLAKYQAIAEKDYQFHLVEHLLREAGCPKDTRFLRQDESYVICRDFQGGIESGMHGDLGPNGARGTPRNLAKMGRAVNSDHTHTAGIWNNVFTGGTSSLLDMGYNKGPGAWSHTHIITYKNGRRCLCTMWQGKYKA